MPGFITHYLWGLETYHSLAPDAYKHNLYQNKAAFSLGLQGPDLFFYFLPSYLLPRKNLGSLAHTKASGAFFKALMESAESFSSDADYKIAAAYLTGFLGHYTLDTICHPYVYARTHYHGRENAYFSRHSYLEMDIDRSLLYVKLGKNPSDFYHENTIRLTPRQTRVIAEMLHHAYAKTFPRLHVTYAAIYASLYVMPFTLYLMHDNTGQKKAAVRLLEKHTLGYPLFSPLILSDCLAFRTDPFNLRHARWTNPWDSTLVSHESFFELYEKAMELYRKRILSLEELLAADDTQKKNRLKQAFLADYGNNSFHSGLDVSIPS